MSTKDKINPITDLQNPEEALYLAKLKKIDLTDPDVLKNEMNGQLFMTMESTLVLCKKIFKLYRSNKKDIAIMMYQHVVDFFLKIYNNPQETKNGNIKWKFCLKPMFEIYNLNFSYMNEKDKSPDIDELTFILINKLKVVFTKIVPTPLPDKVLTEEMEMTRIYMIEFLITVCLWINNIDNNLIQDCYLNSISYEEIEGITQFSYNKYKNNDFVMKMFHAWKEQYLNKRKVAKIQSSQRPEIINFDDLLTQMHIQKSDYDNIYKKILFEDKDNAQSNKKPASQPKKGKEDNSNNKAADKMKQYQPKNVGVSLNQKNLKFNEQQQDGRAEGNPNDNTESQVCDFSQSDQLIENNPFQQTSKLSPTLLLLEQQNQGKFSSNKIPQYSIYNEKHKPNLTNSQEIANDGHQKNDLISIEEAQESLFQRNYEGNYPQEQMEQQMSWNWNVLANLGEKDISKPKYFQNQFAIFRNPFLELGTQIKITSIESFNCVYCKLYIKNSTLTDFKGVSFGLSSPTYSTCRVEFNRAQIMVGKGKQEQVNLVIRNSGYPILPITVKLQIEDTPIKHFVIPNSILSYVSIVVNPSEELVRWADKAEYRDININVMNKSMREDPSFKALLSKMKTYVQGQESQQFFKGIFELQLLKKLMYQRFVTKQQSNQEEYKFKFALKFKFIENKKLVIQVSEFYPDYEQVASKPIKEFRNVYLDQQVLQMNLWQALSYVFEQQKILEGQEL